MLLKVGELAKQTGLTVRTLHHYDEIGLLTPSNRSDAGYRLYGRADIARLHRIQALSRLGVPLAKIGDLLASDGATLPDIITQQLAALEQQMAQAAVLRERLIGLRARLCRGDEPELADWLTTLELMTMYDKYFTPDELQALEQHKTKAKDDGQHHWPALIRTVREAMKRGVAPEHDEAQALARQWTDMLQKLVGDDPGLLIKLDAMTRKEATVQAETGIDPALIDYISAAMAAVRLSLYAKYLEPDELRRLAQNRVQNAAKWPPLIGSVRKKMELGARSDDVEVKELARAWQALFDASISGGDPALQAKLRKAWVQEPELLRGSGIDPAMLDFMRRAIADLSA